MNSSIILCVQVKLVTKCLSNITFLCNTLSIKILTKRALITAVSLTYQHTNQGRLMDISALDTLKIKIMFMMRNFR